MPDHTLAATTPVTGQDSALLSVDNLVVRQPSGTAVVGGVSFGIRPGETVALVGESGSGKSLTARAIAGLLPPGLTASGQIRLSGQDLLPISERRMRPLRGRAVALLLQDPFTMLNPLTSAGTHLAETLGHRRGMASGRSATAQAAEITRRLAEVGIDHPGASRRYPFELSGGMRQRVAIAAAIAKDPQLLIADEPTTALDATTQREVLRLLHRLQRDRGMGLLLITHDLRVAFSMCDRVLVMRAGEIVERANPATLMASPQHEYTVRLLAAELPLDTRRPDLALPDDPAPRPASTPLLAVSGLTKRYQGPRRQRLRRGGGASGAALALDHVELSLGSGRSVGVVGESGSGKTTLARCLLGLEQPTSGTITVDGLNLSRYDRLSRHDLRRARRLVQCVFQDPYSSLNPSHSIRYILAEAIRQRDAARSGPALAEEAAGLLASVGLPEHYARRHPAALSGGERQRVAIARALALDPRVLICDEPVAALDMSVQDKVLRVLRDVRARGVSLLFITHDLAVARQMTDDLVVLYRGEVVETGPTDDVLDNPQHDYTRRLLAAVPTGDPAWLR